MSDDRRPGLPELPGVPSPERRRIVRVLGLGTMFGAFAGALGGLAAREAGAQAATKPASPAAPATPPVPSDEAKALHSILVGRYGEHLDAGQQKNLLEALENTVQSGKALRARKLANAVEPDVVFAARPPERDRRGEAGR